MMVWQRARMSSSMRACSLVVWVLRVWFHLPYLVGFGWMLVIRVGSLVLVVVALG